MELGFQSLAQGNHLASRVSMEPGSQQTVGQECADALTFFGLAKGADVIIGDRISDVYRHGIVDEWIGSARFSGTIIERPEHGFRDALQIQYNDSLHSFSFSRA